MKFLTLTSMPQEPVWSQAVLTKHAGYTMFQLLNVRMYWRVMRGKFPRSFTIHKAIRFFQLGLIRPRECGTLKPENYYKLWRVMKIKSFLACSTMKEIRLSRVLKITHARSGGILRFTKISELKDSRFVSVFLSFKFITWIQIYLFLVRLSESIY